MVVPTGAVVCGRADGLHRTIERFSCEWFNRRIRDDPPYLSLRAGCPTTLLTRVAEELRRAVALLCF